MEQQIQFCHSADGTRIAYATIGDGPPLVSVFSFPTNLEMDWSRPETRVWPSGEWGSLPIEGGVMAAYRREIESAPDPEAARRQIEQRLVAMRSPFRTAEAFNIEDIVDPRETRALLCRWVRFSWKRPPRLLGKRARGMRP